MCSSNNIINNNTFYILNCYSAFHYIIRNKIKSLHKSLLGKYVIQTRSFDTGYNTSLNHRKYTKD